MRRTALLALALLAGLLTGSAFALTPPQKPLFFISVGVTPVINCNFQTAGAQSSGSLTVLPLCPTTAFTRSSAAQDFNASALVSYATDVPRVPVYNPSSGAALGLRPEELRTNKLQQSNAFGTAPWVTGSLTVTQNATGPAGANTAWSFVIANGLNNSDIKQSGTVTSGAYADFSVYLKNGTLSGAQWVELTVNSTTTWRVWLDLVNGVKGAGSGTGLYSYNIVPVGSGWYRLDIAFLAGASSAEVHFDARVADSSTTGLTGDGVNPAFFAYGAQLEVGSMYTTYIPTTAATATRAADNAAVDLTKTLLPANPTGLTIVARGRTGYGVNDNNDEPLFYLSNGGSANAVTVVWDTIGRIRLMIQSGGASQLTATLATGVPANTDFTVWIALGPSNFSWQMVGQTKGTQSSGTLPVSLSSLKLGQLYDGTTSWNGTLARLIVYNTRLSDGQAAGVATAVSLSALDVANDNVMFADAVGF